MTAYVADLSALTSPAANDFMLVSDTSDPLNTDKKMALQYLALKSGTPTAGRVASWTDANQIQDGGFLVSDFARKTGTPTGGRIASWTDANAVQDGGFLASDAIRKPTALTPVANNLVRWNAANTVDDSGIAAANVPQKSGTLVAGNNAHWSTTTGTLVDSGFAASAIARKSGTPVAANVAGWADANTVNDGNFALSDIARLSVAQTYTASQAVNANLTVLNGFLILTESAGTLAGDTLTPTASMMRVDTEGAAATDNLFNILAGPADGAILILRSNNGSRDTTIKNGTGTNLVNNIRTSGGVDRLLGTTRERWMAQYYAAAQIWVEISYSANAA